MVKNILIGLVLLSFMACNQNKNNNLYDNFFNRDLYKLPLNDSDYIYSTYLGIKDEWHKKINSSDIYISEGLDVDSIGYIEDEAIIVIYNKMLYLSGQNPKKSWIIVKGKDIIKTFYSYEDYESYCSSNYNKVIKLYEPSDLYKIYVEDGNIKWNDVSD